MLIIKVLITDQNFIYSFCFPSIFVVVACCLANLSSFQIVLVTLTCHILVNFAIPVKQNVNVYEIHRLNSYLLCFNIIRIHHFRQNHNKE